MQSISTILEDTLERDVALEMYSRVNAEWELNGYYDVNISGSPSTDDRLFPMEDIIFPRRPVRTGLPKLVVGQGRLTDDFTNPKYRVGGEDSNYKYYHSQRMTNNLGNFTTPVELTLMYPQGAPCNKFVAGFETSFATPLSVRVYVTYNGSTWVNTGLHNVDADGLINLWLQPNNSWGGFTTLYEDNYLNVRGWRIVVSEMTKARVGVGVTQMSPRLTMDLTNRVIDVSVNRQREELNLTNPIGTSAASTIDIQFANEDRFFDRENVGSPINNLIDRNVRFDVVDTVVRQDGNSEQVAQGVVFADDWSTDSVGQASVSCTDRSKFLQETIVESSFYWNKTAEYVVKDMLDRFGHPNYDIRYATADASRRIPYVFFKDEETVWDALSSLARAEQASFYFDEQDFFVWESRDYVWQTTVPDWTLRNEADGLSLPNLISWNPRFEVAANKVNIKYTTLSPASDSSGVINNVVWEESDALVLNASALQSSISTTSTVLRIVPEDFDFWPEEGIVNVDGEYMRFEKTAIKGRFTITERGLFDSPVKSHSINPADNNWRFRVNRRTSFGMQKIWGNSYYGRHSIRNSYVELSSAGVGSSWTTSQYYCGNLGDSYAYYGTELVFPVSSGPFGEPYYDGEGVAGIMIHNNGTGDGYYFEALTSQFAVEGDHRKTEIRAWRRNGVTTQFLGDSSEESRNAFPSEGRFFEILPGARYRIEVLYRRINFENQFTVFVNGQSVAGFIDDRPGAKRTSGYWGVFCRAKTNVRFDAAWAVSSTRNDDEIIELYPALRDRITGGFNSGMLESLWRRVERRYWGGIVFEDFGQIVHSGIEYDVDYEISPNTATDLFVSNDEDTFVIYHDRDPFSSKFAIMGKSREDAVVVGTDPSKDDYKMSMFVYGRPIVEEDERTITREDVLSRRRRGLEELEVSSPWIQTKPRAERIANWLVQRWGQPNDVVEAGVIVAPHIQVGDLIEINAPSENLYPGTHRYNVVGISKSVGSTHSMSLTLRRRR